MRREPPKYKLTETLCPYTTLFRVGHQFAGEAVDPRVEAQRDRIVGQRLLEGGRVEVAGALVEQAGDQPGPSLPAGRIRGLAADEGEGEGEDRVDRKSTRLNSSH